MHLATFTYERPKSNFKPFINVNSERNLLLKEITDELNIRRLRDKMKPLTTVMLVRRLKPVKTKDLYVLISKCKQSCNFDSTFWWATRPENIKDFILGRQRLF